MISAITNQGKVRFMIYEDTMTAQVLIKFMTQLIKGAAAKIFLILDNLRVHHAKLVDEWLKANKDKIEVFFLPAYSPELNPDEYLNCDLKAGVHSGAPARNAKGLKRKVVSHMRKLQSCPPASPPTFGTRKFSMRREAIGNRYLIAGLIVQK